MHTNAQQPYLVYKGWGTLWRAPYQHFLTLLRTFLLGVLSRKQPHEPVLNGTTWDTSTAYKLIRSPKSGMTSVRNSFSTTFLVHLKQKSPSVHIHLASRTNVAYIQRMGRKNVNLRCPTGVRALSSQRTPTAGPGDLHSCPGGLPQLARFSQHSCTYILMLPVLVPRVSCQVCRAPKLLWTLCESDSNRSTCCSSSLGQHHHSKTSAQSSSYKQH